MRLTVSEFRAEETPVAAAAALCAAMTARDVQDWAAGAQPGAQRLYAVGGNATRDAGAGVAAAVDWFDSLMGAFQAVGERV